MKFKADKNFQTYDTLIVAKDTGAVFLANFMDDGNLSVVDLDGKIDEIKYDGDAFFKIDLQNDTSVTQKGIPDKMGYLLEKGELSTFFNSMITAVYNIDINDVLGRTDNSKKVYKDDDETRGYIENVRVSYDNITQDFSQLSRTISNVLYGKSKDTDSVKVAVQRFSNAFSGSDFDDFVNAVKIYKEIEASPINETINDAKAKVEFNSKAITPNEYLANHYANIADIAQDKEIHLNNILHDENVPGPTNKKYYQAKFLHGRRDLVFGLIFPVAQRIMAYARGEVAFKDLGKVFPFGSSIADRKYRLSEYRMARNLSDLGKINENLIDKKEIDKIDSEYKEVLSKLSNEIGNIEDKIKDTADKIIAENKKDNPDKKTVDSLINKLDKLENEYDKKLKESSDKHVEHDEKLADEIFKKQGGKDTLECKIMKAKIRLESAKNYVERRNAKLQTRIERIENSVKGLDLNSKEYKDAKSKVGILKAEITKNNEERNEAVKELTRLEKEFKDERNSDENNDSLDNKDNSSDDSSSKDTQNDDGDSDSSKKTEENSDNSDSDSDKKDDKTDDPATKSKDDSEKTEKDFSAKEKELNKLNKKLENLREKAINTEKTKDKVRLFSELTNLEDKRDNLALTIAKGKGDQNEINKVVFERENILAKRIERLEKRNEVAKKNGNDSIVTKNNELISRYKSEIASNRNLTKIENNTSKVEALNSKSENANLEKLLDTELKKLVNVDNKIDKLKQDVNKADVSNKEEFSKLGRELKSLAEEKTKIQNNIKELLEGNSDKTENNNEQAEANSDNKEPEKASENNPSESNPEVQPKDNPSSNSSDTSDTPNKFQKEPKASENSNVKSEKIETINVTHPSNDRIYKPSDFGNVLRNYASKNETALSSENIDKIIEIANKIDKIEDKLQEVYESLHKQNDTIEIIPDANVDNKSESTPPLQPTESPSDNNVEIVSDKKPEISENITSLGGEPIYSVSYEGGQDRRPFTVEYQKQIGGSIDRQATFNDDKPEMTKDEAEKAFEFVDKLVEKNELRDDFCEIVKEYHEQELNDIEKNLEPNVESIEALKSSENDVNNFEVKQEVDKAIGESGLNKETSELVKGLFEARDEKSLSRIIQAEKWFDKIDSLGKGQDIDGISYDLKNDFGKNTIGVNIEYGHAIGQNNDESKSFTINTDETNTKFNEVSGSNMVFTYVFDNSIINNNVNLGNKNENGGIADIIAMSIKNGHLELVDVFDNEGNEILDNVENQEKMREDLLELTNSPEIVNQLFENLGIDVEKNNDAEQYIESELPTSNENDNFDDLMQNLDVDSIFQDSKDNQELLNENYQDSLSNDDNFRTDYNDFADNFENIDKDFNSQNRDLFSDNFDDYDDFEGGAE